MMVILSMRLKDYLHQNQISYEAFAESIGYSYGGVLKWIRGDRFPRPSVIARISEATNGAVTANDFAKQIQEHQDSH